MTINTVRVYFPEDKPYNGVVFKAGRVYAVVDEPDAFIERWEKRGCSIDNSDKPAFPDPRFHKAPEAPAEPETEQKPESENNEKDSKPAGDGNYEIKRVGPLFAVFDSSGEQISDKPTPKATAQKLFDKLTAEAE